MNILIKSELIENLRHNQIVEVGNSNRREITIHEFATFMGAVFNIDIRDCYNTYTDMKQLKHEVRTRFPDKMRERLNKRTDKDHKKRAVAQVIYITTTVELFSISAVR